MNCLESPQTQGDSLSTEGEGFEPPKACTLVVFKTTAIDHSAIPPASINNTAVLTPLGDAWGRRSTKAAEARRCRSSRSTAPPSGPDVAHLTGRSECGGCGAQAHPAAAPIVPTCLLSRALRWL